MNHFEQSARVANFLSLPCEIRDRIYELILDFEDVPPEAPDEDPERRTIHPYHCSSEIGSKINSQSPTL